MTRQSLSHRRARDGRAGMTLVELLVTMVIVAIFTGSLARLMIHQSRFFDNQRMAREARTVSRGALNVLISDLRMVQRSTGLVSISPTALTARVPYAFGIVCATVGGASVVSLAPADSLMFAEDGFTGFAWRDSTGAFVHVEGSPGLASGNPAACTAANVATLTRGRVVSLTPALPVAATPGTLVFLFRRMTYEFRESEVLPGRIALWRVSNSSGDEEELLAPFDSTAGFRYFAASDTVADELPPASLATVTGVQLLLNAESERAPLTGAALKRAKNSTAVFFMNRTQ